MEKKTIGEKYRHTEKKTRRSRSELKSIYDMYSDLKEGEGDPREPHYDLPTFDYCDGAATVAELVVDMIDDKWRVCGESKEDFNLNGDELSALYTLMDELRTMGKERRKIRLIQGALLPHPRTLELNL